MFRKTVTSLTAILFVVEIAIITYHFNSDLFKAATKECGFLCENTEAYTEKKYDQACYQNYHDETYASLIQGQFFSGSSKICKADIAYEMDSLGSLDFHLQKLAQIRKGEEKIALEKINPRVLSYNTSKPVSPATKISQSAPNPSLNPKIDPSIPAKTLSGKTIAHGNLRACKHKHNEPRRSKNKGFHVDEDCCIDPDEYPNPLCYYSEKDLEIAKKPVKK